MTYTFKLSRRIACLRAPLFAVLLLAVIGCNQSDTLDPDSSSPAEPGSPIGDPALASASSYRGIPFGWFAQPVTEFGGRYNGAMNNISPNVLLKELAATKARGGRVIVMFVGNEENYKDGAGHFDMGKWRARLARYEGINFSSYIKDGTIVGHYLIDEPYDPVNWHGQPIPGSVVEEMAKYSKQLWPTMATIARAESYLLGNGPFRYLDAAWAQFTYSKGDPKAYISRNVSDAQKKGLGLIVGLNVTHGGANRSMMTASQVESFGSALLASSYPCAFISWKYNSGDLASNGMKSAMDALRRLAENRGSRECRGGGPVGPVEPPPPPPGPPSPPPPPPSSPPPVVTPVAGVPFGAFNVPTVEMSSFSGAVRGAGPRNVLATALAARKTGARIIFRLTGGDLKNANGTFSLAKWKAAVDRYASVDLSTVSGTIVGHLLIQNPQVPGSWGGQRISYDTLEEMARYSRQRWPWLPTVVQAPASWLAAKPASWKYLDASLAMYNGSAGDAGAWIGKEANAAGKARLGLLAGMNVLNGGTGASGLRGTVSGRFAMSASQLQSWGSALVTHSQVCGLVMASYDATYFGRSDVAKAMTTVGAKARGHGATSCRVRS